MGSKRSMLQNGLGTLLDKELIQAVRFFDLFTGSGTVASHVAQRVKIPVLAFDLQNYSVVLAGAVLRRTEKLNSEPIWSAWQRRAAKVVSAYRIPASAKLTRAKVAALRGWSEEKTELLVTRCYGGHYFSPKQAVWIDAFLKTLPKHEPYRTVARASLIQAASRCAAAPGHTAQPFQPTRTAKKFLEGAWERDIQTCVKASLEGFAKTHAQRLGKTLVDDANSAARKLRAGDLVFLDPPYSGVHYSRFYHVLETIARGQCREVTGTGRYPSETERPRSRYSVSSEASKALNDLFAIISKRGARAILTFPDHKCSNGLSGDSVRKLARQHFYIKTERVKSLFSTLGGTGNDKRTGEAKRKARHLTKELILVLHPKGAQ